MLEQHKPSLLEQPQAQATNPVMIDGRPLQPPEQNFQLCFARQRSELFFLDPIRTIGAHCHCRCCGPSECTYFPATQRLDLVCCELSNGVDLLLAYGTSSLDQGYVIECKEIEEDEAVYVGVARETDGIRTGLEGPINGGSGWASNGFIPRYDVGN